MEENSTYAQKLTSRGIRPSVQRIAIYKFLCENKIHPTVDTVFKSLYPDYPTLSRTTVYNTLHLFALQNLIQTVKIEDDEIRYDADVISHGHFKCVTCGRIFDIFDDVQIPEIFDKTDSLLPQGFKSVQKELNVWGYCKDCSNPCGS